MTIKNKLGEPIEIIFIAGFGRSGSTLLDRILGSCSNTISLGEASHVLKYLIQDRKLNCTCNQTAELCPFWGDIVNDLSKDVDAFKLQFKESRSDGIYRMRDMLNPFKSFCKKKEQGQEYQTLLLKLYQNIAKKTDARYIIDSSKNPADLDCLLKAGIKQIQVIHLIRDSRGAAYSSNKKAEEQTHRDKAGHVVLGVTSASLMWMLSNMLTERIAKKQNCRVLRVLYNQLTESPESILKDILSFISKDKQIEPPKIKNNQINISSGHIIAGNPNRFTDGLILISEDNIWKNKMLRRKRIWTTILTYPILKRYGFLK